MWLRRAVVILPAIAMTAQAAREKLKVLDSGGLTTLIIVLLVLFVALFAWIALSFTSAVAGFVSCLLRGGRGLGIGRGPLPAASVRTALLMPTYNEQPSRVIAGLEAIHASLVATGQAAAFDIFILSDTTDADIWVAEEAAFLALRGRKPFGGHKLSHDFIEAALLRRGGWAVRMVPGLAGSYEESPPSLPDLAIRDRRWCQGNLQHIAVLPARGLHWVSRMHLLTGIGSYITAPMWLGFIIIGILISLQSRFLLPDYFPNGKSLFPTWPIVDPERAKLVFIATMALLLAPKLFAYVALLCDARLPRGCGGAVLALLSMLVETVLAGLLAPVTMLTQSLDVAAILAGRDAGWNPQRRDDGGIMLATVARLYAWHTRFGVALAVAAFLVSPYLLAWMSPVVAGQALAIPQALVTGRASVGVGLRRLGLLRIPEEGRPPAVLAFAVRRAGELGSAAPREAMRLLCDDAALRAAHMAMLPPPRRHSEQLALVSGLEKLDDSASIEAAAALLSRAEKAAVLGSAAGLARLMTLAAEAQAEESGRQVAE